MVLFVTSKVPWSVSCVKILRYLLKIINPLTLGQIKLCMDPVNKNQKKKKSKFWFFNNYAKSYFCKNKIVSAKKLKIFDNAFMHLERSVMMSRFQNWKPNWKLSNIDRVIDKKFRWYSLKLYICSCNSVDFLIWFSVLKSTHRAASCIIHKNVIYFFFFYTSNFFLQKPNFAYSKIKILNFFFGFLFTGPIYNVIWPRVSIFVIFVFSHSLLVSVMCILYTMMVLFATSWELWSVYCVQCTLWWFCLRLVENSGQCMVYTVQYGGFVCD